MTILKAVRIWRKANISTCQFCTKASAKPTENVQKKPTKKHLNDLNEYFKSHPHLEAYRKDIPQAVINFKRKRPEQLYLICPEVAKVAAKYILDGVKNNQCQMIAEINPGMGLITKELLAGGVDKVHLFEPNELFHPVIKNVLEDKTHHVCITEKNLLSLAKLAFCDQKDGGARVEALLQDVPHKKWTDDPAMSVIGPMMNLNFLKHLTATIILQKSIWNKGRIDLYTFISPSNWEVLIESNKMSIYHRSWMILFSILFNVELIEKFDRKLFIPWTTQRKNKLRYPYNLETDKLYFIKITMKKVFPVSNEDMVPFFVFVKSFIRFTNKEIIPTIEKWVPGCGKHLIAPKQKHLDYYEDLNIFTKFKELSPIQTLAIFKEMISHPNYHSSPFMEMIEAEFTSESAIPMLIDVHTATQNLLKELKFQ